MRSGEGIAARIGAPTFASAPMARLAARRFDLMHLLLNAAGPLLIPPDHWYRCRKRKERIAP